MKMNIISILGSLTFLASCSSSLVSNPPLSPGIPDYVVRERNTDSVPEWFSSFNKWKNENDGKGYIHFMGESGEVNDRISGCELASLMAKKKISEQLAELVTSKIGSQKNGKLVIDPFDSDDEKINQRFESLVAAKSIGLLSGVEDQDTFWERRDYTIAKGSSRVFSCAVLVRISEKDFKSALKKSGVKAQEVSKEQELKEEKSIVSESFRN